MERISDRFPILIFLQEQTGEKKELSQSMYNKS